MTFGSRVVGKWPYFAIVPLGIWLDLWSKAAAFDRLRLHESHEVIANFFWIEPALNPGGVGGLGRSVPWLLVAARLIAIPVLLWFAWRMPARERLLHWALALVTAGALGNIWDNLTNVPAGVEWGFGEGQQLGMVRDFLKFRIPVLDYFWPTFNIADSMIVVGACFLALTALFSGSGAQAEPPTRTPPSEDEATSTP